MPGNPKIPNTKTENVDVNSIVNILFFVYTRGFVELIWILRHILLKENQTKWPIRVIFSANVQQLSGSYTSEENGTEKCEYLLIDKLIWIGMNKRN